MSRTFGEQLKHFAMSIDDVDEDLCRSVRNLVDRYLVNTLTMNAYHVMVDGTRIKGKPALRTAICAGQSWSNEMQDSIPIQDDTGKYKGQSTFAYEKDINLWVTAEADEEQGKPLNEARSYLDHWSKSKHMPEYFSEQKTEIRTSIVTPLKYGDRVFGFLCTEAEQVLECTEYAKREIRALADAVAIILWLHEGYLKQKESRKNAFLEIEGMIKERRYLSPLSKPKLFFASSSRADREVVGEIRQVITKLDQCVQEVFWREIKEPGDITAQVIEEISQCRFGICYLSEPSSDGKDGEHRFIDNPNVIFEAGMLQSLTTSSTEGPVAWIPIRETDSPPAPFDVSNQRTLFVNRLNDGALNTDSFHTELHSRLARLLGVSPITTTQNTTG
jgi:hypothetical protein